MNSSLLIILIILFIIGIILHTSRENFEAILYESPNQKKISEMLIPNCNMLNNDYGDTCRKTKGCVYDEDAQACYYNWIDII
jgi:hypothetical protein